MGKMNYPDAEHRGSSLMSPLLTPQKIKKGWAFEKENKDHTGIKVFYDEDTGEVYFYWHYS